MNGYVSKLVEEGQSFEDFTLACARAFNVLVDEPLDAPLPESMDCGVSYHQKGLGEAQEELIRLQRMDDLEREAFGISKKLRCVNSLTQSIDMIKLRYQRVIEMETTVKAWNPPSLLLDLKNFMLSQLEGEKRGSTVLEGLRDNVRSLTPLSLWEESVETAMRDIEYHKSGLAEAKKQAEDAIEWVKVLKENLQSTPLT